MSSTIFTKPNPSPAVTRRPPVSDDTGSTRNTNRRSLSDKLRNLFRKNSSSPNRTTNNDGRLPPTSVRQASASPELGTPSNEAPHLRAPMVNWSFGKKKAKTSTPTTSKTKIKGSRKTKQTPVPPMEISSPIYQQENQTSIHSEHFVPRSPDLSYNGPGRLQSSSSYEANTAKGYRDYIVIDQTQPFRQVVVPEVDGFMPPTYTSDRSRSPSMNNQRWSNTNTEYHYHHDNSQFPPPPPLSDIEVISAPQRKRKGGDNSPLTASQILAKKPPILPQTSSIQPINVTTNPNQWKSVSSSSLNNSGKRSTLSSSSDVNNPKLYAPVISFGSSSGKKKEKRSKSQSRQNAKTNSSSTINNLVQQNPVGPNRARTNMYGSLPDAEILSDSNLSSSKPSKKNTNKYPYISAIVQHHMRLPPVRQNERPYTTSPTTNLKRPERFETSTTTLNENEQWPDTSPSSVHRHDGYIRPFTPQKPSVQPNINVIRLSLEDLRARSPSPPSRPSRYDSPEPPATYRSSATIYTRDKHRYVDGGEIRTWSSQDNGTSDDHIDTYKKLYIHVHIEDSRDHQLDRNDYHVVPPKIQDHYDEYRYSPRAHEQDLYKNKQRIKSSDDDDDDQEVHEEEQYEVSFEYEGQVLQSSIETRRLYDELHATNRYSGNINDEKTLFYPNVTSTARSSNITERDKSSRLYTNSDYIQEPLHKVAPVGNSKQIPRTYILKRRDSYDGLGITISSDLETRTIHTIREVERGSPGDQAGLRKNDRIISINGINVENVDFSNVLTLIKQGLDDDNLQFSVIHSPEHI